MKFLAITHQQLKMHDENNEKKFFIIISKEHKNKENDRDLIINALNKIILKVNYLKDIVQKFVKATEYKLRLKSFSSDIKKEIQQIIK